MNRFPKGIRGIVDQYAGRIEQAVQKEVLWDSPLGCGSFGCVFPVETEGQVLKISTDPTEGPVVKALMDTGLDKRLNGLARWYGIWRIPGAIQEGPRSTGWVILREEVSPFDPRKISENWWSLFQRWFEDLRHYNEHARKSIDIKSKTRSDREWQEARASIGELYGYEETYFIAEAIEELTFNGIRLADIHDANLGFRIYPTEEQPIQEAYWADKQNRPPLLIFDLGHSSAPSEMTVEDLWETPAAPGLAEMSGKIPSL